MYLALKLCKSNEQNISAIANPLLVPPIPLPLVFLPRHVYIHRYRNIKLFLHSDAVLLESAIIFHIPTVDRQSDCVDRYSVVLIVGYRLLNLYPYIWYTFQSSCRTPPIILSVKACPKTRHHSTQQRHHPVYVPLRCYDTKMKDV